MITLWHFPLVIRPPWFTRVRGVLEYSLFPLYLLSSFIILTISILLINSSYLPIYLYTVILFDLVIHWYTILLFDQFDVRVRGPRSRGIPGYAFFLCPSALVPLCPFALAPLRPYALMPLCPYALAPLCPCALMPLCPYALMPLCPCALVPSWPYGLVPLCPGALVPLCS